MTADHSTADHNTADQNTVDQNTVDQKTADQKDKGNEYLLGSVKNALRILNSFTMEEPEKRVSDLAQELGLGKSTVSRLLSTLASEGFVQKDPETQKYRLGLRILTLNSIIVSKLEVSRESRPVLRKLVNETGESAHVAILEDKDVVYVEQVECAQPVRILSYVGRRNPAHCTSTGKLLLAFQDDREIDRFLQNGLVRFTEHTITDPEQFRQHLRTIRQEEFCYSINEFLHGVISMAVPIRDYTGRVVASVALVGPEQRIRGQIPVLRSKLFKAGQEISSNLGYFAR